MANVNISTPAATSDHAKLIDPGIKKIWYDQFSQLESKMGRVLKMGTMDTNYEDHSSYAGLGDIPLVGEGSTYTEDSPLHTYDTTYQAYKYGRLVPVTYELMEDQLARVAGSITAITKAKTRKVEKLGASMIVNAHDTSFTSYGDGLPLCSTAHTRVDGGSNMSNASATGVTLTEANLETGILAMRNQVDDRGNLIDVVPSTLLVPPALEKEAIIITKSEKRSETADNDANVDNMAEYTGGKCKVVVWDYLGSTAGGSDTAWFLLSNQHEVTWKWRVRPQIKKLPEAVGVSNDVWYWKARFRAAYGWTDFRGIWGSKGDGLTYSS